MGWKVIDNRREIIYTENYATEQDALNEMRGRIAEDKLRRDCYDYDVALLEDGTTYEQYMESIED